MDAGNIIYIVAVIIYFIYTAVKKGNKNAQPNSNEPDIPADQREKVPSFEELLREIRSGQREREEDFKNTGQGEVEKPIKRKVTQPASVEVREENKHSHAFDKYSGAVSDSNSQKLKTLDEQVSLTANIEGLIPREERATTRKQQSNNRYRKLLQSKGNVKDAIILSEILNRKHF
ncbi:hypothetical protein SAMN06295967_11065 [Belliella buryatensis]|uniref:Uncharacterized protein n=1 Tax=Belliella buryatensis TaxID=1500549 RepID=A0A239EQ11_9BACT|nr:hypothetical protein [Belliella buryatensis]SNS46756.1 hypothetical protein SAMN06295967_11065 [Belliella buryatensis]